MSRINRLLLSTLPLLLFGSGTTESTTVSLQGGDASTWRAIVCKMPEEAFAAIWDISEGRGLNGSCKRETLSRNLRETVSISYPYPASFYDFGDWTAVELKGAK